MDNLTRLDGLDPRILSKQRPFDEAELGFLREFYAAWEALHKIPNDPLYRKKKEEAAQALVNHAHVLRRMYG